VAISIVAMKNLPLGWKIALWSAFLVGVSLLSSGIVAGLALYRELIESTDKELKTDSIELVGLLTKKPVSFFSSKDSFSLNINPFEESSILELSYSNPALIYKSPLLAGKNLFEDHAINSFFYAQLGDGLYRVFYTEKNGYKLALGKKMLSIYEILTEASYAYLLSAPFALILSTFGGWWISRKALLPIRQMTSTLEQIRASALHQRLSIPALDPDLKRLVTILNEMLGRLEEAFQREIRLTADASHELKTPLTILKNELESALQRTDIDSQTEKTFLNLYEQVQSLSSITQTLLFLSNLDRDSSFIKPTRIDISQILNEILEDTAILAASKGITIEKQLPQSTPMIADEDLIRRLLWNIFDNAIQYNISGGYIGVSLQLKGTDRCLLQISNSGPVVPEEERKKIFERFYRGKNATEHGISGHGLGLNLCREIVLAHKGEITYLIDEKGHNQFSLLLPTGCGNESEKKN